MDARSSPDRPSAELPPNFAPTANTNGAFTTATAQENQLDPADLDADTSQKSPLVDGVLQSDVCINAIAFKSC